MSGKTLTVDRVVIPYWDFGSSFLGSNLRSISFGSFDFDRLNFFCFNLRSISLCSFNFCRLNFFCFNLWSISLCSFDFERFDFFCFDLRSFSLCCFDVDCRCFNGFFYRYASFLWYSFGCFTFFFEGVFLPCLFLLKNFLYESQNHNLINSGLRSLNTV